MVLRSCSLVLTLPALSWVEEPPPTTEPSVPQATLDSWTATAHSEKLVLALVAVYALGTLAGLLLGKK